MRKCEVPNCHKVHKSRGYCGAHYENYRQTGNPYSLHEQKAMRPKLICAIDDCESVVNSRSLCKRHYQNLLTLGQPVPVKDLPITERLKLTGWTVTLAECWEWNGKRNDSGYGIVNALREGYVGARAHRVMYELEHGPIAAGTVVRHRCDNPPCVNPAHLAVGSQWDNTDDMVSRGRSGHLYENQGDRCRNGHDMTAPGAYVVRDNPRNGRTYRTCVECSRRRSRDWARRNRTQSSRNAA